MNHQPFETWLLNDQPLSHDEKRKLVSHLRGCQHCTNLAETGLALRNTHMVSPAPGFTARFQVRLEAQRLAQRRRNLWGVMFFIFAGLGVIAWLLSPLFEMIAGAPLGWLSTIVGVFLFIVSSIQALFEVGFVLLRVAPGFVPPYLWLIPISGIAGFVLLWTVSIWRVTRVTRGV